MGWAEYLEAAFQVLPNHHHGPSVVELSAVIRGAKNCDEAALLGWVVVVVILVVATILVEMGWLAIAWQANKHTKCGSCGMPLPPIPLPSPFPNSPPVCLELVAVFHHLVCPAYEVEVVGLEELLDNVVAESVGDPPCVPSPP